MYSGRYRGLVGKSSLADDVGDCARTATLSVHVAIVAAIGRILRDIRFSFPAPSKEVLDTVRVRAPMQALDVVSRHHVVSMHRLDRRSAAQFEGPQHVS